MIEIFFGFLAGIVSSLGMGGGALLIYLLTTFLNIDQHISQGINLLFFIPTSLASIFMNLKNHNIKIRIWIMVCFFGVIGAIIGSKIAVLINVFILKKLFGIFLIIVGIIEIYNFFKRR